MQPQLPGISGRPLLLDLFCGAGGAAVGYHRAGWDVVGVDVVDQPDYPFPFVQADALTFPLDGYDAIHASPPCQAFTQMSARWRGKGTRADEHLDLLTPTLTRLGDLETGAAVPWVVENVVGAAHVMGTTVRLHGGMFGLRVHRPRLFQSNVLLLAPKAARTVHPVGVYGAPDGRETHRVRNNGNGGGRSLIRAWKSLQEGQTALGVPWITSAQAVADAIPPAYTQHLGEQLLCYVRS